MVFMGTVYLLLLKAFLFQRIGLFGTNLSLASASATAGDDQPAKKVSERCPISEQSAVCNEHTAITKCVCGMYETTEPIPERTCSALLNLTIGNTVDGSPEMEAVSVKLKLSAALIAKLKGVNAADNQMEQTFSETLSRYFRIDQKNIIILRLKCAENLTSDDGSIEESDHDLIIQFVMLRRGRRPEMAPFRKNDLLSATMLTARINSMPDLEKTAGFHIVDVERVDKLLPVESDLDNSLLAMEAIIAGGFFVLTTLCGCAMLLCRRHSPEGDGYEQTSGGGDDVDSRKQPHSLTATTIAAGNGDSKQTAPMMPPSSPPPGAVPTIAISDGYALTSD